MPRLLLRLLLFFSRPAPSFPFGLTLLSSSPRGSDNGTRGVIRINSNATRKTFGNFRCRRPAVPAPTLGWLILSSGPVSFAQPAHSPLSRTLFTTPSTPCSCPFIYAALPHQPFYTHCNQPIRQKEHRHAEVKAKCPPLILSSHRGSLQAHALDFTFMFVGSLYVFPLKTKQERARERYVPLVNWDELPSDTSDTAEVRRESNHANNLHNSTQPLSSPRPSSSSASTFENGHSTPVTLPSSSSSSSNTIILTTKSPTATGVADNRAHRISTHLNFIDTTTSSTPTTASPRSSATASTLGLISPSSSAVSPSVATFTSSVLAASGSVARPEVAIHPHTSSQFDQSSARYQSPVDNQKLDRDHPLVIVQRFKGILLTCFLVPLYLWWLLTFSGAMPANLSFWGRLGHFLRMLGISIPGNIFKLINHAVIPLFLVSILFMGPVLMMFLSNELPFQQAFDWASQRQHLRGLIGTRNFVVGPLSEEFIFRACMVAIVAHAGASSYAMIFGLPWVFGIGRTVKFHTPSYPPWSSRCNISKPHYTDRGVTNLGIVLHFLCLPLASQPICITDTSPM
ncbi:unnamed protein product [Mortierella alpina]